MCDYVDIIFFEKFGYMFSRVICVFGMCCFGNYVLINWLMCNVLDVLVFMNNCVSGKCLVEIVKVLEVGDLGLFIGEILVVEYCVEVLDGGVLIILYEDFMLDLYEFFGVVIKGLLDDVDCLDLVLFCGFMNWFVFLLCKLQNNDVYDMYLCLCMMINVMECYIDGLELVQESFVCICFISYDCWVSCVKYCVSILCVFGFE